MCGHGKAASCCASGHRIRSTVMGSGNASAAGRPGDLEGSVDRQCGCGYFAAGSACANEPPTAPRLRICKWPISALALMSRVWQQHTGREPAASRRSAKG